MKFHIIHCSENYLNIMLHCEKENGEQPFKLSNTELNPIFHFLALLGAHHIIHVSKIRVKWRRIKKIKFHSVRQNL